MADKHTAGQFIGTQAFKYCLDLCKKVDERWLSRLSCTEFVDLFDKAANTDLLMKLVRL